MRRNLKLHIIHTKSKFLLVIGGPTASGKSSLAIDIAIQTGCDILSADSRQFYKELNIGTAKPTDEEMAGVRHHFINTLSIHDRYSVGRFEKDCLETLDKIYIHQDMAILTGGTGLYIRAVCEGLDAFPEVPKSIAHYYEKQWKSKGLTPLQKELYKKDQSYARVVDMSNPQRLIRALSVIEASGLPFSHFLKRSKASRPFNSILMCLMPSREKLYSDINARVDSMVRRGLEQEVRSLYAYRHLRSLQTVGYREWIPFFEGKQTREETIDKIKQHTRNYAKRQTTWFRNQGDWHMFDPSAKRDIVNFICRETGCNIHL